MEKKKIINTLIVLLAIGSFGAVSYIAFWGKDDDSKESREKNICTRENDQAYFEAALADGNLTECSCIGDVNVHQACVTSTEQAILYQQAIAQVDERICEKLDIDEQRNACNEVVVSKKEYLLNENPEQLSSVALYNHNDAQAIVALEKILAEKPDDVTSLVNLSYAYANQAIYGSLNDEQKKNNIDKAVAAAQKAQTIDDNNAEGYRAEAFAYEAEGSLEKSLDLYTSAVEKFPNNILLLNGRGHVESMLGYILGAIETFKRATSMDADMQYAAPWMNLCRLQAGDSSMRDDAKNNCQKIIDMPHASANDKSEALQILAQVFMMQNQPEQALDQLMYARTLSPMNDNIYVTLASVYNQIGDGIQAEQMALKALEINGAKTSAYFELGRALGVQERYNEAITALDTGLSGIDEDVSLLLPNKPRMKMDIYYLLSDLHGKQDDLELAQRYKLLGDDVMQIINQHVK